MGQNPMDISASALSAERLRMDVIASNIANINSTRNANGQLEPYRRKMVVFKEIFDETSNAMGVTVDAIEDSQEQMRIVYDPSHPDANQEGYVTYSNVNLENEMVDLVSAKAAYEANITALQTYKSIVNSALDI